MNSSTGDSSSPGPSPRAGANAAQQVPARWKIVDRPAVDDEGRWGVGPLELPAPLGDQCSGLLLIECSLNRLLELVDREKEDVLTERSLVSEIEQGAQDE